MPINDYLTGIDRFTSGEKQDVQTASQNLADLQTGAGSLPNKLKEALNQKLSYNKDIINQQSDVMQQYFAAPSAARAKYQDVWNPFEREKLVAQERTMALKPYDTLTGVLNQRMGDVADITTAGVQGWQGMVDAASTQLNAAQTRLSSALQAYQIAGGQQNTADELALSIAQFNQAKKEYNTTLEYNKGKDVQSQSNWEKEYLLNQYKARNSGNGDDLTNLTKTLKMFGIDIGDLTGGDETNTSNESVTSSYEKPPYSSNPGTKMEWPKGSGIVWEATIGGGWQ